MIISPEQCRAARGLLGISQEELAAGIEMGRLSVSRFESNESGDAHVKTVTKIFTYFDNRSIIFFGKYGVDKKPENQIRTLHGTDGFRVLMDEVYDAASEPKAEIALLNGSPTLFINHLGQKWYKSHAERMLEKKDNINFRIIAEKGGNEIAGAFANYRWINQADFHDESYYIYGDHMAVINFSGDDVTIEIFDRKNTAQSFFNVFNILWNNIGEQA